jgi:hypothetical protein
MMADKIGRLLVCVDPDTLTPKEIIHVSWISMGFVLSGSESDGLVGSRELRRLMSGRPARKPQDQLTVGGQLFSDGFGVVEVGLFDRHGVSAAHDQGIPGA